MLALGKPRPVYEFYSVRDLRRLRSRRSGSEAAELPTYTGGFVELGGDDGVDDPNEFPERPERKGLRRW